MLPFALAAFAAAFVLFYLGRTWLGWVLPGAMLFYGWWQGEPRHTFWFLFEMGLFALFAVVTGLASVRRQVLTSNVLPLISPILPRMSDTEKVAIEAGT